MEIKSTSEKKEQSMFCSLPYDIRALIYDELFPDYSQLYLQATKQGLLWTRSSGSNIPLALLRTNKFLNREAGEYLYNRYLFNIIGRIQDCVRCYPTFEDVLAKYARQPVRLNAFGNGEHSDTCCISLQPGSRHLAVLNKRRRGTPSTIEQLKSKIRATEDDPRIVVLHRWVRSRYSRFWRRTKALLPWLISLLVGALAAYIAWLLSQPLPLDTYFECF